MAAAPTCLAREAGITSSCRLVHGATSELELRAQAFQGVHSREKNVAHPIEHDLTSQASSSRRERHELH